MELRALVIEPDTHSRRIVREALTEEGWQVVEVSTAEEAAKIDDCPETWSLVFYADSSSSSSSTQGFKGEANSCQMALTSLRSGLIPAAHLVVMGRGDDADEVLRHISSGASDYVRQPCNSADVHKIAREVRRRMHVARKENTRPILSINPSGSESVLLEPRLIGASTAIVSIYKKVAQSLGLGRTPENNHNASNSSGNRARSFLITGETGTGKELVARLIHRHSEYQRGAFVPVNCSTLPVELAESELFGHEQGAFTGALKEKEGLWQVANEGTLFLDEITEAPHPILPKLLRVLQDGTVKRVGANRWTPVNVQVIAASNRDLKQELRAGRFREDLYHRLSLYHFHLPPLRERRGDIPLLVSHFAQQYAPRPIRFSQGALELLMRHSWTGNVRELENLVRAAVTQSADGTIYANDLLSRLQSTDTLRSAFDREDGKSTETFGTFLLEEQLEELKLKTVKEALRQHRGNITRTAAALGMTRPTLYKILKKLTEDSASREI